MLVKEYGFHENIKTNPKLFPGTLQIKLPRLKFVALTTWRLKEFKIGADRKSSPGSLNPSLDMVNS